VLLALGGGLARRCNGVNFRERYQSYDGFSVEVTNYRFAMAATLITVWVLVMAVLMGRKTMAKWQRRRCARRRALRGSVGFGGHAGLPIAVQPRP
jgi:threonine/homoserine/homoserine lactone efflux protein